MTVATTEAVRKSIFVNVSPEDAFRVFTEETTSWWPLHRYGVHGDNSESVTFDARTGGTVVERAKDGTETVWAEVVDADPPNRLLLRWHPDVPEEQATEVEVRFVADGDGTRVELEHRGWERLGERAERSRANYDGGWNEVLGCYASAA